MADGSLIFSESARSDLRDEGSPELRRLAVRLQRNLRDRVPQLTPMIIDSLSATEPAYRNGTIPADELPRWIDRSVNRAIDALTAPRAELPATLDVPRHTGKRRGEQGVPPRSLLKCYHVGGKVTCSAILSWASAEDLSVAHAAALVDRAWGIVEAHSSAALTALDQFIDHDAPGYLVDALLNGDARGKTVASVSRSFGIPEDARYAVVAVHSPSPGAAPVRVADLLPFADGMRVTWRVHGDRVFGVVAMGSKESVHLKAAFPSWFRQYRTGISMALAGLSSVGRAREQAEAAARSLSGPGLAFFEERLHAVLVNASPSIATELQYRVLSPLIALPPDQRKVLLQTLVGWIDSNGSPSKAAEALYCHRNTVINRIRRVEELTGRSLASPSDLVDLVLALEAFRQSGGVADT